MTKDYSVIRYTHTEQDKLDDISTYKEFSDKFDKMLATIDFELKLHEVHSRHENFGVTGAYFNHFEHKEVRDNQKNRVTPSMTSCFISSKIWGIINNDDPIENLSNRTFKISFDITTEVVGYRRRHSNTENYKRFYKYSSDMDTVIAQFKEYLLTEIIPFINKYEFTTYVS